MKKILILVLSADFPPYDKMISTQKETWDSLKVEGSETLYYCGESTKTDTETIIYLPVKESLKTMGEKTLQALEYALKNREFDYIARVHSSCYVSKQKLVDYVQGLPETNVFEGLVAPDPDGDYCWGGGHYLVSKDVVQKIVENRDKWNHKYMEDKSMSYLVKELGIPFRDGNACSINRMDDDPNYNWLLLNYGFGESIKFNDFADLEKSPHYFFRVKQDQRRERDEYIMKELHNFGI